MAIHGTISAALLGSKHIDAVKYVAKTFGLPVTEDKDGMIKTIIAYQEGRCPDCEKNNTTLKSTMVMSSAGRAGCKNC